MSRVRSERIMKSLPSYYQNSNIMQAIVEAQAAECDGVEDNNENLQSQLAIATATWGLKLWEHPLGIATIESDSYEIRRSRILAGWRGMTSQFSGSLIRQICEVFSGGAVQVTVNPEKYQVTITFVGTAGVPTNIEDLRRAVELVAHAHLEIIYAYTYTTWDKLAARGARYDEIGTYTWEQLEVIAALYNPIATNWGSLRNSTWSAVKKMSWGQLKTKE